VAGSPARIVINSFILILEGETVLQISSYSFLCVLSVSVVKYPVYPVNPV